MGHRNFRTIFDFGRFTANAVIRCDACKHDKTMTAREMAAAFGPIPIHQAESRCRCQSCGHRGATIVPIPA